MRLSAALACALLFAGRALAADGSPQPTAPMIPTAWLVEKISVAEAEAAHPGISDERVRRFPQSALPFAFQNAEWEALKAAMQPGDEIWNFASPADSWKNLAGRAGVALVRGGQPIKVIVTIMN